MTRIGCCGYTVAKTRYHENFGVIELPQTFFQPPSPSVLASWRAGAPQGFEFVVRAWQLITHDPMSPTYSKLKDPVPDNRRMNYGHFRPTAEVRRAWEETVKAAQILRAKIVVFQTPPNFKPSTENADNMRAFFGRVKGAGLICVWDARAWRPDDAVPLCDELGLVYAVDPFRQNAVCQDCPPGDVTYVRLPGKGGFKYCYTEEELRVLAGRCGGRENTYVIFDNSYMFENALLLKGLPAGQP